LTNAAAAAIISGNFKIKNNKNTEPFRILSIKAHDIRLLAKSK
jgi:hypothetical protein